MRSSSAPHSSPARSPAAPGRDEAGPHARRARADRGPLGDGTLRHLRCRRQRRRRPTALTSMSGSRPAARAGSTAMGSRPTSRASRARARAAASPAVAMSANRSVWIQYAGGNDRDWQLFTATRTLTKPRQLAFVEQDVELPSPIVVGQGTLDAVPYAVKQTVTYLGDNGRARSSGRLRIRFACSPRGPARTARRSRRCSRRGRSTCSPGPGRSCAATAIRRARSLRSPWRRRAWSSRTGGRIEIRRGAGRRRGRCRRARRCSAGARARCTTPRRATSMRAGVDRRGRRSRPPRPGARRSARSPPRAASPGRGATRSTGPARLRCVASRP